MNSGSIAFDSKSANGDAKLAHNGTLLPLYQLVHHSITKFVGVGL